MFRTDFHTNPFTVEMPGCYKIKQNQFKTSSGSISCKILIESSSISIFLMPLLSSDTFSYNPYLYVFENSKKPIYQTISINKLSKCYCQFIHSYTYSTSQFKFGSPKQMPFSQHTLLIKKQSKTKIESTRCQNMS